jgi:hypothetical protein
MVLDSFELLFLLMDKLKQGTLSEGERISTIDLLVLPTLDQMLFILKNIVFSFTKQAILMRRSIVLSLSL